MARGNQFVLSVLIRGRDRLSGAVRGATRALGRLDNMVTRVGAALATYFGARALANFFGGAIGSARYFEAQLARVQAVAGASAQDMERLRAIASEMGRTTRFTATQAAEGLEILARAGVSATDSVELLPTVLQTAQASGEDLATAAGLITDSLGAFGQEVSEAGRFADVLTQGAQQANTSVTQLGRGLSYAGVQAQQAGLSVEQTVALLDALANAGIRGERAGTALRNILGQLADPASKARKELRELGIDTGDLNEVLAGLEDAGANAEQAVLAFGLEAGPAVRTLLQAGLQGINQYTEALRNAEGTAAEAAATMDKNLDGALRGLGSAWDALQRRLVRPVIRPLTAQVRELIGALREFTDGGQADQFAQRLRGAFEDVTAGARRFIRELGGIEGVVDTVVSFTERAGTALRGFSGQVTRLAGGIRIAWNTISAAINGVATVILMAVARIANGVQAAAEVLNRVGVVSDETLQRVSIAAEEAGDAWQEAARRVRTDLGDIADASRQVAEGNRKIEEASREAAAAAEESGEQQAEAADTAAEAVERTSEAYRELRAAIESAASADDATQVVRDASRAYDEGRISAFEFGAAMAEAVQARGRMADAAGESTRATQEEAAANEQAADSADALADALEGVGESIGSLSRGEQLQQAQIELQRLFRDGEISAEQYRDGLGRVNRAHAELRREERDTARAAGDFGDTAARAGDEAASGLDSAAESAARAADGMEGARAAAAGVAGQVNALQNRLRAMSEAALATFQARRGFEEAAGAAADTEARIAEINRQLENMRGRVYADATGILRYLRDVNRAGLETEKAFLEQRAQVERLTEALENGRRSTNLLALDADRLSDRFNLLDDQDLSGLRSALRSAQQEVESLRDGAQSTLSSLRDELARTNQQFVEIERRRAQQERADIQAQLAEAREVGDEQAVRDLEQALALLAQVEQERVQQAREREREERRRAREEVAREPVPARRPEVESQQRQGQATQRIELVAPSGREVALQGDEESVQGLLEALQEAGMRTQ